MLKEDKRNKAKEGEVIMLRKLKNYKVKPTEDNIKKIYPFFKLPNQLELTYRIAVNKISLAEIKKYIQDNGTLKFKEPAKTENH